MPQLQPKPLFEERMRKLLADYDKWLEFCRKEPLNSIRCNTLKTSPEKLKKKLEEKGWKISQPWSSNSREKINHASTSGLREEYPQAMIIESNLAPGALGKSFEHLLGYYYIQELSSMLPVLALQPKPCELVLDLCASPGSKTTQACAMMENSGTVIANDKDIGRMIILASNTERCGCTNLIITRNDAVQLCQKLHGKIKFDKILLDVPCSGEGTIRSSPKTFLMWNIKMIQKLGRMQKKIASSAIPLLKENGVIVYSTCTHAPEENESVVSFLVENFNLEVEKISLPLKTRPGITEWQGEKFNDEVKKCCRIYPQDNDTEGFFVAKLRKT